MLSNKPPASPFKKYRNEIILVSCWLVVQTFLFIQHGIETGFEARKYIEQADHLIATGTVTTPNFWLYSVQIFLIAAAKKMQAGYISVVIIHWVFNLFATLALYRFASRISNTITGLIVALLLIFNTPLQTFNSFLQTESLFFSFTILFTCYLLGLEKLTWKNFILILLMLILLSFTRPTGLLWMPAAFLYLFFRFFKNLSTLLKVGITVVVATGFLFFLNSALGSGGELDFMLPFRDERIICGVPTLPHFADIKTSDNPNSIFGLIYYITHNFDQFIRLAWLRSKAFFGLYRPYYSTGHNLYLCIYFFPLYILAILSLRRWLKTNISVFLYCFFLTGATWGTVILTCDDWHNRFFLTIVPYIYIFAIPAIKRIADQIKSNASK